MNKNKYRRFSTKRKRNFSLEEGLDLFFSKKKNLKNYSLINLWDNWNLVVGEDFCKLALPLGAHEHVLIIGAEDNMLMNELSFLLPEFIARANAFMDEELFTEARLELLQGRTPLYPTKSNILPFPVSSEHIKPQNLGKVADKLADNPLILKAYLSYLDYFDS